MKVAKYAKFQHNISKITPAKQKNTGTWGVSSNSTVTTGVNTNNSR